MTPQRPPPFRAEHLGSLLRPKKLLEARQKFERRAITQQELTTIEDESVREIVQTQLDLGYHAVSDGEYRRGVFWGTFFQELEGMTEIDNPPMSMFREYVPDVAGFIEKGGPGQSCVCTGKIKHTGKSTLVDQFTFTRNLVPKDQQAAVKLTMISPVWYHLRYKEGQAYPKDVYGSEEEYFADIAKAYRVELDILYEAGVRNVQIDDPLFAYFCSKPMIEGYAKDPSNTRSLTNVLAMYIQCYNDCLSHHKDKIHFGLHICRGNFRGSRHFSTGSYEAIAQTLFTTLSGIKTFYLEFDTPRAGPFTPLAHLPSDKHVVLGVVTSKFPELEDLEMLKGRVWEAADVVARGVQLGPEDGKQAKLGLELDSDGKQSGVVEGSEKKVEPELTARARKQVDGTSREEALIRISVSPQCGFASHEEGNAIGWEDMLGKLALVRRLAGEIWGAEH